MSFTKNIFLRTQLTKNQIKDIVLSIITNTLIQHNDGKIYENNNKYDFIIRINTDRMDHYIPIIKGKIYEADNINIINLKIGMPVSSRILLSIIFGMIIIGLLLSLIMLPEKRAVFLPPSIGLMFVIILSQLYFVYEYIKIKKYLISLFKAEKIKDRRRK
jgi:hypothetical protein